MAPKVPTTPNASPRAREARRAARREQTRAEQRVALALAMIDAVAEKGYRESTVADVIARAGVSRKTFYQHFANKQECFLATYDQISARAIRRLEQAYQSAEGWPGRVEATIQELFEAAIENPGAMRVVLLDINALGQAGIERRERSRVHYERFIRDALELAPGKGTLSDAVLTAVIGGLNRVLYRRVLRGERAKLLALVPDLVAWITSYYPTPASILAGPSAGTSPDGRPSRAREGGRAPGTLSPHAYLSGRRGLPRGDQNISRSFVVHSQRERILDAVANLTAARGYIDLKVEDIAEQAAVSLKAFYEHFADKEDAFLVAYEIGHGKALAATERAYVDAGEWQLGVRAGLTELFEFLAAEPAFAHIALVDALVATDLTAERSNVGVDALAKMLVPGLEEAPGQTPRGAVTIEAIAGGIFELCLHYALQDRIGELPELTVPASYIALTPFLGSRDAARVAVGAGRTSRR
ncbi:MAG: transcriptional regulator, TetR family [Solirubrobacterales bacterium]|jgi:AcrR family transcriptional regulator|nr:transcriptional regulator, TetR family [Solirubrobacterales bacterium]